MTYCLGIKTREGVVLASDSRTNAGYDQVNICCKMHTFVRPGERAIVILSSGSLSLTQSIIKLLEADFEHGGGLAKAPTLYDAARVVGEQVRRVSDMDREALERDEYRFNVHLIVGGQIGKEAPDIYLIYPQGNPLCATEDSPYLQIGECKYGRPILDRGISFTGTPVAEAAKYALISLDSTMRSNVTVGPPIDMVAYYAGDLNVNYRRRFLAQDPDLLDVHARWERSLRNAVQELPPIQFEQGTAAKAK
jgi:putative proteasome-type protease